jgi:hypothetical protein
MKATTFGFAVLMAALAGGPALAGDIPLVAMPDHILTDGWTYIDLEVATDCNPPCGEPPLSYVSFALDGVTLQTQEYGSGIFLYGSQLALGEHTVTATYSIYDGPPQSASVSVTVTAPKPGIIFTASSLTTNNQTCLLSWDAPGYSQLQINSGSVTGQPLTRTVGSSGTFQTNDCSWLLLYQGYFYYLPAQYFLIDLASDTPIASTSEYGPLVAAPGPAPAVTSLSPSAAPAGSADVTLQVNGSSFSPASLVMWNNESLATHFESATLLQATVPASLLINQGTAQVAVADSGQLSTALPFAITPVGCDVTFTADPNPIVALFGIGQTTLSWNAPCHSQLKITVGSPTGTPLTGGIGPSGAVPTGTWVTDGLQFFLVDTTSNTAIASLAARVCTSACEPVLTSLAPGTVPFGAGDLTLQAAGFNFDETSVVTWNNEPLPTQYLGPTLLQTTVPAGLVAYTITAPVTVSTGDQVSDALPFLVSCPDPVATLTANPNPVIAKPGVGITTLSWNAPCYGQLEIRIGSATGKPFTGQAGPSGSAQTGPWVGDGMQFFLVNLATGASLANVTVYVVDPSSPAALTSISPLRWEAGAQPSLTLQVSGSNFSASSAVTWNGVNLATQFQTPDSLQATIPAYLLSTVGIAQVAVATNGLVSGSLPFTIGAAAFLDNALMTDGNASGGTYCPAPPGKTEFLETDGQADVWFQFDGANGDPAQIQWFAPDGTLYQTTKTFLLWSGCETDTLWIQDYLPSTMPGGWKVVATIKGQPFFALSFAIEPGPVTLFDGVWNGTVGNDPTQPLTMTVASDRITSYSYQVSEAGCPSGTFTSVPSTSISIVGNSFSSDEFSGTFTSGTTATGSQTVFLGNTPPCPGFVTVTWNATKQ